MQCTKADQIQLNRNIKRTAVFSAVIMMTMCCLTGTWALVGGMVGPRPRYLLLEALEPRIVLDGGPLITEFMADNESTMADEDGDTSDWIEAWTGFVEESETEETDS